MEKKNKCDKDKLYEAWNKARYFRQSNNKFEMMEHIQHIKLL